MGILDPAGSKGQKATFLKRPWAAFAAILLFSALVGLILNGQRRPATMQLAPPVDSPTPLGSASPAADYLARGDQDFDRGDYNAAIADYSQAIELNPNYAEAYNNRAYTYMTVKEYALALPDLDEAIRIRPNYVNALMNRGDIYNFYYKVDRDRAITDYNRVLAIDPTAAQTTSVCGHREIAENNGLAVGVYLRLVLSGGKNGCS